MNKKILYLSIAVVVLIISASSVTALVSPPPGIKEPTLSKVWAAIMDLQNQILKIPAGAQGPTGPTGPTGTCTGSCNYVTKTDMVADDQNVDLPAGFTVQQCAIIVSPKTFSCGYSDAPFLQTFISYYTTEGPSSTKITVHNEGLCESVDMNVKPIGGWADYLIICHS